MELMEKPKLAEYPHMPQTGFLEAVIDSARNAADELVAEAEEKHDAVVEEARKAAAIGNMQSFWEEHDKKTNAAFEAMSLAFQQQLLRRRTQLVEEVFNEVGQDLKRFTETEEYGPWLQKNLRKIAQNLPQTDKAGQIQLREVDKKYSALLREVLPEWEIVSEAEIKLGGVRVLQGGILLDETLDTALITQREAFLKNSGLSL